MTSINSANYFVRDHISQDAIQNYIFMFFLYLPSLEPRSPYLFDTALMQQCRVPFPGDNLLTLAYL